VHATRGFHALAFDFALGTDDGALRDHLEWLFAGFAEPASVPTVHRIERAGRDGRDVVWLCGDDDDESEHLVEAHDGPAFVSRLVQWVNRRATRSDVAIASHAGGVARGDVACALPAHTESGKTTLTAGLVRAGFDYLTDEAVAFTASGVIEPFAKPLSIDPGSQFLFPELEPPLPPGLPEPDATAGPHQWHVPASMIRRDVIARPCRARAIVFPKYDGDGDTTLQPVSRAEGLIELARNTFEFRTRSRYALDVLADVVRAAECYRLAVGDLESACAVIDDVMAAHG
jgi:hypothetical protein